MAVALPVAAQICPTSCPTADDAELEALIAGVAASGGGVVPLQARVYLTCKPIIVPANIHLKGEGRGATIIRGSSSILGVTVQGSYVGASIATVASNNVTVSDLTVDHATCSRNANGVAFMPASQFGAESYDGTVCEKGLITGVEVLGASGFHNYMIWNLRGKHIKIVQNWIDGGTTASGPQEGIESFGGHDVVIENNTVRDIGGACINLGSAGISESETNGIFVTGNHVSGCNIGVHLGTSSEGGDHWNMQTRIRGNVIRDVRQQGIGVAVMEVTQERALDITGNTIQNVIGEHAIGIYVRAVYVSGVAPLDDGLVVANTVDGNHIDNVRGVNAHGIRVMNYTNLRLLNNTVTGTDYEGVFIYNGTDIDIVGNRVERSNTAPLGIYSGAAGLSARVMIERNRIRWSSRNAGILLIGAESVTVKDNVFSRLPSAFTPSPIASDSTACDVTVSGNVTWYETPWKNLSSASCP
jgi:parallel beta-helix repeat protein